MMKPQQQQINVSEQDTTLTVCPCGCDLFDVAYRHRVLPGLSQKNPSGQDMPIKIDVFVCWECGLELGKIPKVPEIPDRTVGIPEIDQD